MLFYNHCFHCCSYDIDNDKDYNEYHCNNKMLQRIDFIKTYLVNYMLLLLYNEMTIIALLYKS